MPITAGQITTLKALRKPKMAAYWAIYWDFGNPAETRYYSDAVYNEMSGYLGIGLSLEAQILTNVARDTAFEINPDIKAEKISIKFNDIPARGDTVKPISSRFQTFKSGVRCELFFYYPDVDAHVSQWTGQLQAPDTYGHDSVEAVATNGFRSREQLIPKRTRPRECTANFGGRLSTQEAIDSNGCPYNRGVGGSLGALKPNGQPYTSCPRNNVGACNTRMGTADGKYYLGFDTSADATVTSGNPRVGPAISQGNQSTLTKPIRIIYGQKYVRDVPLLVWRREIGAPNPNHDWVSGVWEFGEGPIQQIYNAKIVGGRVPQASATQIRLGSLGQPIISNWGAGLSNFSYTVLFRGKFGWINAKETNATDMTCEGRVMGYTRVPVYSNSTTFSRVFSDNRVWCLFDLFTSQRFGMGYAHSRFEIADWKTVADWTLNNVSFTATDLDGGSVVYGGRRSTFDAIVEGRPAAEQIEDICRSGSFSIPFLHNGKFTVTAFRPATAGELTAAPVFSDNGDNKNIVWEGNRPAITFGQIPDDKVINEVALNFEEAANEDVERPFTVDDPNQKLKAGRVLGNDNLQSVPKKFSAFGIGHLQEVARLGYRILRFGEHESGGTQNNLNGTFTTPAINVLGVKRYDIIKLNTTLDDNFTIGTNDGVNNWVETPEYYRIRNMKKVSNGLVEVTVQAYNHTAYTAFETVASSAPPVFNACSIDADCPPGYICVNGICVHEVFDPPCELAVTASYNAANGLLELVPGPCNP